MAEIFFFLIKEKKKKSSIIALGFPGGSVIKNRPADAGDMGSIPGLGRSLAEENGNSLPYSGLGNA